MSFKVYIVEDAEQDIVDIYDYIALSDSLEKAEYVLQNIEKKCLSLSKFPNRGRRPPELERIGIFEYREIHFKPYRIIYQVIDQKVYVHCVLDGRRELQKLLEHRLLRSIHFSNYDDNEFNATIYDANRITSLLLLSKIRLLEFH